MHGGEAQERLLRDPHPAPSERTGNVWTAAAHIITGVIGSGVLSLAWSVAQLGWIAGPSLVIAFAAVTFASVSFLAGVYRSPHPVHGLRRNRSYLEAVACNLGSRNAGACGIFVFVFQLGMGIAYTVTSAISMRAIQKSNCYHNQGHRAAACHESGDTTTSVLLFGVAQIITSQIPDFHSLAWLSFAAAIMSFTYSSIGFALSLAKLIRDGEAKGSISGVPASTSAQKAWLVAQAVGDIAFAYQYFFILFEILDTLKSPPPENHTMKKASALAISITACFYLCCGLLGYAAFGNSTPGNLLTGFGFYEPYWLVNFANVCIVLHLVGGYQVYSQPQFAVVEEWSARKLQNSRFVRGGYAVKLPWLGALRLHPFRVCVRIIYVALTTAVGAIFPYFNQVLGVLGAMIFWTLGIYFPLEIYLAQNNIGAWTRKWILLQVMSGFGLLITTFALIGSIEGLVTAKSRS